VKLKINKMKTKIEIKSIYGSVLFSHESEDNTIKETLKEAIKSRINLIYSDLSNSDLSNSNLSCSDLRGSNLSCSDLRGSNLSGSDLSGSDLSNSDLSNSNLSCSDLRGSNLSCSDLRGSNLSGSNLSCSDLRGSDLRGSDLSGSDLSNSNLRNSNLRNSNLRGSDLRGSNLRGSDLRGSNLSCSDLRGSNLSCSDLRGSDLRGSDLSGSDLSGSNFSESTPFLLSQCPSEGSFIAWKKANGLIIKLKVTENSKRSSATTLKCRCSEAEVLEIQNIDGSICDIKSISSNYISSFIYEVGKIVSVPDFDEDRFNECSAGIHFFISREMAVKILNHEDKTFTKNQKRDSGIQESKLPD
jgi:uncharacterized protein YjbI with pentapeptide repeats